MAITDAQVSLIRRLIKQNHEYIMSRSKHRGVALRRGTNERRTAECLAYLNLIEIKGDMVYLWRADDELGAEMNR